MDNSSIFGFLLLLCIVMMLVLEGTSNNDMNALASFRSGLFDPQNVLESWDTSLVDPCTWFHVTCDHDNRVNRVFLVESGLSGHLSPQLGNLDRLQYLSLNGNNLQGPIPQELGNLANLKLLNLNDNQFSGTIPSSLGNIRILYYLRLNNNKLRGPIPKELGSLPLLGYINVSNNDLCGPIPMEGSLSNLKSNSYSYGNNPRINMPCNY